MRLDVIFDLNRAAPTATAAMLRRKAADYASTGANPLLPVPANPIGGATPSRRRRRARRCASRSRSISTAARCCGRPRPRARQGRHAPSGRQNDDQQHLRRRRQEPRRRRRLPALTVFPKWKSFMPRLVPLDLNKLTPEQKKVADAIVAGPRGGLRGPFDPGCAVPSWPTAPRSSASIAASTRRCPRTLPNSRSAWSAGTSRRSSSSMPMPDSPRKPGFRRPSSRRCACAPRRPSSATSSAWSTTSSPNISTPTGSRRPTTSAPSTRSASRASSIWSASAATTCWCR